MAKSPKPSSHPATRKYRWHRLRAPLRKRPLLLHSPGCPPLPIELLQHSTGIPDPETLTALDQFLRTDRARKTTVITTSQAFRTCTIPDTQLSAATGIPQPKFQKLRSPEPPTLSHDEIAALEILLNYLAGSPVSPENLPFLHTRHAELATEFDNRLAHLITTLQTLQSHSFLLRMKDQTLYRERTPETWHSSLHGDLSTRLDNLLSDTTRLTHLGHLLNTLTHHTGT